MLLNAHRSRNLLSSVSVSPALVAGKSPPCAHNEPLLTKASLRGLHCYAGFSMVKFGHGITNVGGVKFGHGITSVTEGGEHWMHGRVKLKLPAATRSIFVALSFIGWADATAVMAQRAAAAIINAFMNPSI